MENRHALVVDTRLTLATGTTKREVALAMVADPPRQSSDHARGRQGLRCGRVCRRPARVQCDAAVAQNTTNRRSAIDGRTTRHPGYAVSGRMRKRIEEVFGWTKGAAGFRKTHRRGLAHVGCMFTLTATAYNLLRLPKLVAIAA
jgi:Transposase DDE domain